MDEPAKTEIDGFTFELQALPAWQGFEAFGRLVQVVGPSFGEVSKLVLLKNAGSKLDIRMLQGVIVSLQKAPLPEVISLGKLLLAGCIVSGDLDGGVGKMKLSKLEPIFDRLFRGKLMTIFKLLRWSVEVNFSGFFDDLKNALPDKPAPSDKESSASPLKSQPRSETAGQPSV